MRRYAGPGLLIIMSGAFLALRGGMAYDLFDEWPLVAGMAIYAVGAVWWIVSAATTKQRLWVPLLLVWAPAALPLWPLLRASAASERDDSAAIAVLVHLGPAYVALLASVAGTFVLLVRLLYGRQPPKDDLAC